MDIYLKVRSQNRIALNLDLCSMHLAVLQIYGSKPCKDLVSAANNLHVGRIL